MSSQMINVSVLVDDAHQHNMGPVLTELRASGFVLSEKLEAIGMLLGSVPESSVSKLSTVEGVSTVEPDRTDYTTQ